MADGARCSLATQQQVVVVEPARRTSPTTSTRTSTVVPASDAPRSVAELVDIDDGVAHIDERHADKQPDWTYDAVDSGKSPADRLGEHRDERSLDE